MILPPCEPTEIGRSEPGSGRRRSCLPFLLLPLAAVLWVEACTTVDVVGVIVGEIVVQPNAAILLEGDSLQFAVVVRDQDGSPLSAARVSWSSDEPQMLAIDSTGMARALGPGTATVYANFRGESGTALVTVVSVPELQVRQGSVTLTEADTVAFFGAAGEQSPPGVVLDVENGGGGTLDGLEAQVVFGAGASGWLTASLADVQAPTTLSLTVQSSTLGVGVNHATVSVASPKDPNGTVHLSVELSLTGITITESDGGTSVHESGTTDDFTVVLDAQPETDVVIDVSSSDTGEVTVSPTRLTFTSADWDVPQQVTLTGQDDDDADEDVQTAVIVSVVDPLSDAAYAPVPDQTVTATTVDDDAGAFIVAESGGSTIVTEAGGTDDFTVVLGLQPSSPVVFDVTSADPGEVVVDVTRLTFTPADWATPQTVTVVGVDDDVLDGPQSTLVTVSVDPAASADPFDRAAPQSVDVTTSDDDVGAFSVTESDGSTIVGESGTGDEFTVGLLSEPASSVVLTVTGSDPSEVVPDVAALTFTPTDWSVPQTVTVIGVDDALVDGPQTSFVTIAVDPASSDDAFDSAPPAEVTVTTTDDDNAGLALAGTAGLRVSEAGSSGSFTAVLTAAPLSPVVLRASTADPGEVVVEDPDSLVFTDSDWNTPQAFTVTGVDDGAEDGDQISDVTVSVVDVSSDDAFDGLPSQMVQVTTTDDDAAGFALGDTASLTVSELGTTDNFTVVLTTQPGSNVAFDVSTNDMSEVTASPSVLTFAPGSWNVAQTVTLTGVDDDVIDGDRTSIITVAVNDDASDDTFDGLSQDVSVVTTDDDVAGLAITELGGTQVSESGTTDDFTVALTARPASDVVLDVVSTDTGEATVAPSTLTLTPSDWDAARTITVTGVDDVIDDGDQVTSVTVTVVNASSDDDFDDLEETVLVTTTDDDGVGFTITEFGSGTRVTEAPGPGNQDQFGVALDSEPASNVVLRVASADVGEATIDTDSLLFTPGNWTALQQVTVMGVDDAIVDGTQTTPVVVWVDAALSDAAFGTVPPDTVFVETLDNDGSVSGHVFEDINGDGVQNGGEPGLANVDVVVTDALGNEFTVMTGPTGDWTTTTIAEGIATVDVDDATLPAGAVLTAGMDPNAVTVTVGQTTPSGSDGYQLRGTLTGTVFEDTDGDGVRDGGEPGIVDVDVDVTDSLGETRAVTTDASGDWTASGLPRGPATVDVDDATLPAGAVQTAGADPNTVAVVAGVTTAAGDDGYQTLGGVTGTVFDDSDGDGLGEAGEPGIAGIDVVVTDALGTARTVTTNTAGAWTASGLPGGSALVDVDDATLPPGAFLTTTGSDPNTVTVVEGSVTAAGEDGYQMRGDLTGTVFEDTDGNGVQNGSEPGLAGIDVVVTNSLGMVRTVTTDAAGAWMASDLPRGPATVDVDDASLPAGAVQTAGVDPNTVTVVAGVTTAAGDDGYQTLGAVTGTVFEDIDGDGLLDAGEPGIPGVDVVVNDALGTDRTVTSNAAGDWTASGLPSGSATVDIDDATLPAGAILTTTGSDPNMVTVVEGSVTPAGEDGYQLRGDLTGTVFEDTNGNGVQNGGEPGLAGIDVVVTDALGVARTVTTDAAGAWTASDLPRGPATVDVDDATLPVGAVQTAGTDPNTVTVVAGMTTSAGVDGYQERGGATGTVFEDIDGDAVRDAGEPGIAGVDVVITDALSAVSTVTTNGAGIWTASDLPAGLATVDIDDATLPPGAVLTTAGSDPNTVTVVAGVTTDAGEDGYQMRGELTGTVFEDTDGDGVLDAGEQGIAGVDVVVTDSLGAARTVTTNAAGTWTASGLPRGPATVDVDNATIPAGAVQTAGADPNAVTVVQGATTGAGEDGYQLRGDLTGTVFEDTDGDGIRDAGDPGLPGVDVIVTDAIGATRTVTTDAGGAWTASDLPRGPATVDVDDATLPSGALLTTSGSDPNTVTVVAGVTTDAGEDGYQMRGELTGTVFEDTDGDGVRDAGEQGIAGVDVVVTDAIGAARTVTTDAAGAWTLSGLPGGPATVDVDETTLPAGAAMTAGADPSTVTVVERVTTPAGDDGYQMRGALTGLVFHDRNGNGRQSPNEQPLAGVDVVVTDFLGNTHRVTTDANGVWTALGVPDGGDATVDVDEATLPAGAVHTAGTDPNTVTVVAGATTDAGEDGYDF